MTCKKNINLIKTIQKTWAKDTNLRYFFVSSENLEVDVPIIKIKDFVESYDQLPLKTYLALKNVYENFKFSHIIKVNDDTFVDLKKFKQEYLKYDYVGKFNGPNNNPFCHYYKCSDKFKVSKSPTLYSYAQGGFVLLSRNAIKKVLSQHMDTFINTPSTYRGEDVYLGEILASPIYKKLDIKDEMSEKLNLDITLDFLSIHPVSYKIMHKLLNKNVKEMKRTLLLHKNSNDYVLRNKYFLNLSLKNNKKNIK